MPVPSGSLSASGQKPPSIHPQPSHLHQSPPSMESIRARTVFSKYLMNDIPRGTTRAQLINCLQPVISLQPTGSDNRNLQVHSGCIITDSRLDDELSVAVIEFSDTPAWLQHLNQDVCGFPKTTVLGTLWRGIDTSTVDELGRTEFIRAAIAGDLLYAETLAEFSDTDINVQDNQRRTALHWACAENHLDVVKLCLSMPEFDVGLKDNASLTAFDIALARDGNMIIPALFYQNLLDMDERHPQAALLRMLTMTSAPVEDKVEFPGGAIFEPIEDSNTPLVKALIERGIDQTVRNSSGDTALHVAAESSQVEIAVRLINAGSDVDAKGKGGATPLHYAVQKSEKRMVQALLSWEAKPDAMDDQGKTALELAKDSEMVRHELDRKANDVEKRTPLHRATEDGDEDIVRLLLELGVPVDEGDTTALMCAAKMGYRDIGELLLNAGANFTATDNDGQTALQMATKPDFTQLLLDHGATITSEVEPEHLPLEVQMTSNAESKLIIDTKDQEVILCAIVSKVGDIEIPTTPAEVGEEGMSKLPIIMEHEDVTSLVQAARNGDLTTVWSLLNSGDNIEQIDWNNRTALHQAAEYGHAQVIHALLDRGARVDMISPVDGSTGLHLAAQGGHLAAVKALLAGGADVDASTQSRETSLYFAAQKGHTEVVLELLAAGATLQVAAALYTAAENGHMETLQALVAGGADMKMMEGSEAPALYVAARFGDTKTVQALLAGGADVKVTAKWGKTSLNAAASGGHTSTVRALLAGGANVHAADERGWVPLAIAAERGHTQTLQALLAAGAYIDAAPQSGGTALFHAAKTGKTETVQALLTGGADTEVGCFGLTALLVAARWGYTDIAETLLFYGADFTRTDPLGKTALRLAIRYNHENTAVALRAARVDLPFQGLIGRT